MKRLFRGVLLFLGYLLVSIGLSVGINRETDGFINIPLAGDLPFPVDEVAPEIEKITFSEGEPLQIAVQVKSPVDQEIVNVSLFPYREGSYGEEVALEQEGEVWKGSLAGLEGGTKLAVVVEDVAGLKTVRLPAVEEKENMQEIPFFPILQDEKELEETLSFVDIREIGFAYTEEGVYLRMEVAGEIATHYPKEQNPFYRIIFFNLDEGEDSDTTPFMAFYRPEARSYMVPEAGVVDSQEGFHRMEDVTEVPFQREGKQLFWKVPWKETLPKKVWKCIGVTGVGETTVAAVLKFWPGMWMDMTGYTKVEMEEVRLP